MRKRRYRAVFLAILGAAVLSAFPAAESRADSIDIYGDMRYYSNPGKNGPAEKSFPVTIPEEGNLTINYWSNYFGGTDAPEDRSSARITDRNGRVVWSRENIAKGSEVYDVRLSAGNYDFTVISATKDGRIALEFFFQPGRGAGSFSGELKASALSKDLTGDILRLSGDTSLYLDEDLTVERVEALGYQERNLDISGTGTLFITSEEAARDVNLTIREGEVAVPSLKNFTQTGGIVYVQSGSASDFRLYGGQLNVSSREDGLTGYFEIHGGEVYVSAGGCGVHSELQSGTPQILGGEGNIRGEKRAVLVERLTEVTDASDNLGGRLTRTEIPIHIASNVEISLPEHGYTKSGAEDYLFPSSVKETEFGANRDSGWMRNGTGWWYKNEDGSYPADCWAFINAYWYHFDRMGYMQHGWLNDGGRWYYLGVPENGDTGFMRTGRVRIDGKEYSFDNGGVCLNPGS